MLDKSLPPLSHDLNGVCAWENPHHCAGGGKPAFAHPHGLLLGHLFSLETCIPITLTQSMASFVVGNSTISAHHGVTTVSCTYCLYRAFISGDQ